jgi:ABC-type transport system involved in multi-copper enzyme maturation permease subunit
MIWTIARREIADAVGTGRLPLLFVLTAVVLGTGLLAMRNDYMVRADAYALVRPDGTAPVLVLPPSPLSVFGRELDDVMGRSFEVGPGTITVGETQASANPLFRVFPTPDWLFLFRVILGLLAFLAGYDLICREKAQGTLKLLLAGGASRTQIATGKWLGNWLALVIPVTLAALLWLTLAGPLFSLSFRPGDTAAIATFLILALLYLTVCFTIAAALSALFHDQTTALVTAVLVWAVLVFVVPGGAVLLARQLVPVQPLPLLEAERNRAFGRGMILTMDSLDAVSDAPLDVRIAQMHAGWGRVHAETDRIGERASSDAARLARTAEALMRASPAGAFQGAAARVLGTSLHDEALLKRRIVEHKNLILPTVFAAFGSSEGVEYPQFLPPRTPLRAALASRSADLVALAVAAALSLLVFFIAVREYDVR